MEGTRAARAHRVAVRRPCRLCRACVVVAAALSAASHAGSECIAFNSAAVGHPGVQPLAREADPATDLDSDARIRKESDHGADTLLLAAADQVAQHAADPPPFWFDHVDLARPERTIESRVAKIPAGAKIAYVDNIDNDSLRVYLPANDFAETGPGTVRLSVAGLDVDADRSVAGGRMQLIAADDDRGRFLLESRLSWLYEYLQTEATAAAFFMPGDKGIFAVQGLGYGSNWAILGVGLRWELADGWIAYAGYDAQVNGQQLFHIGSGGLGYAW